MLPWNFWNRNEPLFHIIIVFFVRCDRGTAGTGTNHRRFAASNRHYVENVSKSEDELRRPFFVDRSLSSNFINYRRKIGYFSNCN